MKHLSFLVLSKAPIIKVPQCGELELLFNDAKRVPIYIFETEATYIYGVLIYVVVK